MLLEQVLEEVERAVPVERLARPAVECASDVVEVFLGVHGQVGALGQELALAKPLVFSQVPRCQGLCGSQK